jgi:hypothetical protein
VRRAAAHALGKIGDKAAVPSLDQALQAEIRLSVVWALVQIGDKAAAPILRQVLRQDQGTAIREITVDALIQIGEVSSPCAVWCFSSGLLFIVKVLLLLVYGVDYRLIEAPYIGQSVLIGPIGVSLRLLVPCLVGWR